MLEHTFLYPLGVGRHTEQLWETGVPIWGDALCSLLGFLRQRLVEAVVSGIEESVCVVWSGDTSVGCHGLRFWFQCEAEGLGQA